MTSHDLVTQTSDARKSYFQSFHKLFARLTSVGQSPQILFIGCNDSRVIPEAIMDARPGDLFVLRNLGNVIPPYGTGEQAVGAAIEYAVRRLGIKYIIICGHTDCGAITALDAHLDPLHESHLSRWIEYARTAQTKVDALGVEPDARHRAIVEENVRCQLENLQTYDAVRRALQQDELTLYGWVYDLSTGRISQLDAESDQFVDEGEIQTAP